MCKIKTINLFVGLLLSQLFSISVIGQEQAQSAAQTFTLEQAQAYAIENGYAARNAAKEVEKSKRVVKETISTGLPQVDASGSYQNFIDLPVQLVPAEFFGGNQGEFAEVVFGVKQQMGVDIRASQLIFDGSYFVGLQASRVYLELSKNDQTKTEYDIRQMVTQAYGMVLVSEENVKVLEDNTKSLEQNLVEVEALYENGFVEEQDRDQLALLVQISKNTLENGIRKAEISRNQFKFILGIPIENQVELSETLDQLIQPNLQQSFIEKDLDLSNHIDYKIINTQEKASELLLKQQKSFYLPKLSAFYSYQQNSFSQEFNFLDDAPWFPTQVYGLNLTMPIFSSFGRHHKTQQAKIEVEQMGIAKEQVTQQLKIQAANSKAEYTYALSQYRSAEDNLNLAQSIFDKTKIKYQEGISTSLELTQANNQLIEIQGNYINSALQLINAKSNLDQALNNY